MAAAVNTIPSTENPTFLVHTEEIKCIGWSRTHLYFQSFNSKNFAEIGITWARNA